MKGNVQNFSPRLLFAIGLLSAASIAFQLSLMQILSLVQWHHFAYMVISVALLGFGAAGTCIALFRNWILYRFAQIVPIAMILAGLSMGGVVPLSQTAFVRFDTMLLFADPIHLWRLFSGFRQKATILPMQLRGDIALSAGWIITMRSGL